MQADLKEANQAAQSSKEEKFSSFDKDTAAGPGRIQSWRAGEPDRTFEPRGRATYAG